MISNETPAVIAAVFNKRLAVIAAVVITVLGAVVIYEVIEARKYANFAVKAYEAEEQLVKTKNELVGYTKYADFVTTTKASMKGQTKFLGATVVRDKQRMETIVKDMKLFSSDAIVFVKYSVEYSVGFDLAPDKFDVVATGGDIEVRVGPPMLIASPAVTPLDHQILSKGLFPDEKTAIIEIMKGIPAEEVANQKSITEDPSVRALCEKNLADFLADFLAKQPGVKFVPRIKVVYK